MKASLESRGFAVGILADSLEKAIRIPEYRSALSKGDACLLPPIIQAQDLALGQPWGVIA